ncbi:hypothetical protein [Salinibacterium sp. ZJ450]|uniref:hypothetical protein n=1 Tax=Salinibacterium sp. ZJ450 TaxID=2708338 RepID=UPI0014206661|nr:hypothetical protein [Salinibacterium sp. ZJ450]
MTTQHIGAAGEILVQYQLLKLEIDSARLTTDSGVDLVVYSPGDGAATTVQVKTVRSPMPSGGSGKAAIGWSFPHDCQADMLAVTSLSTDTVWLFTLAEARELAQQHTTAGARRLYWYTDEAIAQKNGVPLKQSDMAGYLLSARAPILFRVNRGREAIRFGAAGANG